MKSEGRFFALFASSFSAGLLIRTSSKVEFLVGLIFLLNSMVMILLEVSKTSKGDASE